MAKFGAEKYAEIKQMVGEAAKREGLDMYVYYTLFAREMCTNRYGRSLDPLKATHVARSVPTDFSRKHIV